MPLIHNVTEVDDLKLGTAQVDALYHGNNFVWSAEPEVAISNQTILNQQDNPTTAVATYTLNSDGTNGFPSEWLTKGFADDCEVQATQFSISLATGGSTSGTLNTWLNLGTTRSWSLTQVAGAGTRASEWVIDVSIRRVSDLLVLDTARITLQAQTIAL